MTHVWKTKMIVFITDVIVGRDVTLIFIAQHTYIAMQLLWFTYKFTVRLSRNMSTFDQIDYIALKQ